jgi:hypothetical protein
MYAWIFRHLPGNTFWRVVQSLVLVAAVVAALFLWVFPAIAPYLELLGGDPAVG